MKGLINKGIEEMVLALQGEGVWEQVKRKAGIDEPFFAVSLDYPDKMTLDLVRVIAEELGLGERETMIAYGRWIVPHTMKERYPTFFKLAGASPRVFLRNMNKVHELVTRSVAKANPPRFEYEERQDGALLMRYRSERRLCGVLEGLIFGVGDVFDQELKVEIQSCMLDGASSCDMLVRFP
ncbi:MAG: heme NO-binding domain-containing protein [Deltaproteobacteria bacterium]|nr:heme NO-binding domain-containing protein [Deltaproteobacteria bacterium]